MKAEAIVYESNTGFTKKYAELLSKAAGLPVYDRKKAPGLKKGARIVYLGWIMAGAVKGYKKAAKKYTVAALAGVGMGSPSDKAVSDIIKKYDIKDMPVFYLQGGFDMNSLHGIYRVMMKNMAKVMGNAVSKKEVKTDEELLMLDLIKNGRDLVRSENLNDIIAWIK